MFFIAFLDYFPRSGVMSDGAPMTVPLI